jgi:Fe2+ or Zn2+ uptake regulation protein
MNKIEFLKKHNIKVTNQRIEILGVFLKFKNKFISVEDIYEELNKKNPGINMSTLYRNIDMLEKKGLLHKIINEKGCGLYSLILIEEHHHHIICEVCGRTTPIEYCPLNEIKEKLESSGFELTSHKLELYGICKNCSKKKSK